VNVDDARNALATVRDPELRRSIVELGMVRDIIVDDLHVAATVVLTTAACPLRNQIRAEAEKALAAVAGGRRIEISLGAMTADERGDMAGRLTARGHFVKTMFGPGSCTRTLAVVSGKGGVGKSTVTANLAVALAQMGQAVALIDADVYGPTIPLMFGLPAVRPASHEGKIVPPEKYGVKVISMGFFVDEGEPVLWRGPMLSRALEQFLGDVLWGSPDFLLIDLPPGTGDIALTVAQMIPTAEMIVVTTPQEAASKVAIKAARMAHSTKHTILGVVENMSYFICPNCEERHHIFGRGGAFEIARTMETRLLGRIPLDEAARRAGDAGAPSALNADTPVGRAFHDIARSILTDEVHVPPASAVAADKDRH